MFPKLNKIFHNKPIIDTKIRPDAVYLLRRAKHNDVQSLIPVCRSINSSDCPRYWVPLRNLFRNTIVLPGQAKD